MGKIDLDHIIREIKQRGLTAYEISKELPLSEAGINKILSGTSEKPRESTLLLLHNYLFQKNKESVSELGENQISENQIPDFIVENEARLLTNNTFKFWLKSKVLDEVNKILGDQLKRLERE